MTNLVSLDSGQILTEHLMFSRQEGRWEIREVDITPYFTYSFSTNWRSLITIEPLNAFFGAVYDALVEAPDLSDVKLIMEYREGEAASADMADVVDELKADGRSWWVSSWGEKPLSYVACRMDAFTITSSTDDFLVDEKEG